MTTPIFLVSLPRSGSTLLQKMLAVSDQVWSAAEPWVMLPFWSMRRPDSGRTIYSHHTAATAINDFIEEIPGRDDVFYSAVRKFSEEIYSRASNGRRFFLDKTPRYYLMIPELRKVFPEARFIILLRNPLGVLASIGQTFYRGRFLWSDYRVDWRLGTRKLADALQSDHSQFVIRYEALVDNPEGEMASLCKWLDISFDEKMISDYRTSEWGGRMGDPTGVNSYKNISRSSLIKWHGFYASSFRKKVACNMLHQVGGDVLDLLGYPMDSLLRELNDIPDRLGFDFKGRYEYAANRLASTMDYRYLKARFYRKSGADDCIMGYLKEV